MMLVAYVFSCLALAAAFIGLGVVTRTRLMLGSLHAAASIVRDPSLDDLAKERAIQRASLDLLGQTVTTTITLVLAFGAAAIPAVIGAAMGGFTLEGFAMFTLRWDVLLSTVAIFAGLAFAAGRLRRAA